MLCYLRAMVYLWRECTLCQLRPALSALIHYANLRSDLPILIHVKTVDLRINI